MHASESSHPALRFDHWDPKPGPHERRHSGRVESSGTAIVHGASGVHGRIVDLAIGGLSLLVDRAVSTPDIGTCVWIELRLDGQGSWLHMSGSVMRVDARGSANALVIKLLVVPPEFEDLVQDELLSALECAQQPRVLIVDAYRARRELVVAAFRATGCHVIEVSLTREAITEIDQSRLHLWAVVIADTGLASRADELRRFLGETYPSVPLIIVGEGGRTRTTCLTVDRVPDLALQVSNLVGMRDPIDGLV
jgi:CheY-like chemotaxis protein